MTGTQRNGRGIIKFWLTACLSAALLLLAGFSHAAGSVKRDEASLGEALPVLSSLAHEAAQPGTPLRLVLKWQGEYAKDSQRTADVTAAQLALSLHMDKLETVEEDGHFVHRAATKVNGVRIGLTFHELQEGGGYVIITLESGAWGQEDSLAILAEQAGAAMKVNGIAAAWNASVQGITKMQGGPETALSGAEAAFRAWLPEMQAAEDYQDETTFSRSYAVPQLGRKIISGQQEIAMQAAIHADTEAGYSRFTIGFPLITIEY